MERPIALSINMRLTSRIHCDNGATNEEISSGIKQAVRELFEDLLPVGHPGVESLHIEVDAIAVDGE